MKVSSEFTLIYAYQHKVMMSKVTVRTKKYKNGCIQRFGGMKLIRKNMTKKLKEGVNEQCTYTFGSIITAMTKDLEKELKKHLNKVKISI